MFETYKLVLILIIYTAILLLIIYYVYPHLKRFFSRKISISIRIESEEKAPEEKVVPPLNSEKFPSVLGETKFVLSQPLPNTTTDPETENRKEKDDTFAPETEKPVGEKSESPVDLETGEGLDVDEEEESKDVIDPEEEVEEIGAGNLSRDEAGGMDFNQLGLTTKTISDPKNSTPEDEKMAGKILSENKGTDLVKSMAKAQPGYAQRISEIVDKFESEFYGSVTEEEKISPRKQKLHDSEEFRNFNMKDIS